MRIFDYGVKENIYETILRDDEISERFGRGFRRESRVRLCNQNKNGKGLGLKKFGFRE